MRVLVFGASGLIGRHIVGELKRQKIDHELQRPDFLVGGAFTHFINCAGLASVDACELDPQRAFAANALGAEHVAMAAANVGAQVVHISTEYVFDGNAWPSATRRQQVSLVCNEWDRPEPLSVYAQSKFAGEQLVAAANPNHKIIRLHSCYGEGGKQFLSRLRGELCEKTSEVLGLDSGRRVQPTWAGTAAKMIVEVISGEVKAFGIFHVGASGRTTVADFGVAMFGATMQMGLKGEDREIRIELDHYSRRPSIILEHRRLEMLDIKVPTWEESLADYLGSVEKK